MLTELTALLPADNEYTFISGNCLFDLAVIYRLVRKAPILLKIITTPLEKKAIIVYSLKMQSGLISAFS